MAEVPPPQCSPPSLCHCTPLLAPLLPCHAYLFEVLEPSKPGPTKLWLAFSTARKAHPQISVQFTPHVPESHPLMLYVDLCILSLPHEPGRGLSCRCPCSVPRTRAVLGFTVGWWDGQMLSALRSGYFLRLSPPPPPASDSILPPRPLVRATQRAFRNTVPCPRASCPLANLLCPSVQRQGLGRDNSQWTLITH